MSKLKIIDKKSEKSIIGERDLLSKLKHPFIVNMICSFQDYENLYLLMDLLTGGDLRYHFNTNHIFSENEIRFFISCIILSLEYIHENNVIHRDIKPENLVCDDKGFVRLTDFGVAKIKREQNSSDTSGTPGYMSPEVLQGQNHSFTVDFYAIGIVGYEFLLGKRPYIGSNRKEIKSLVLSKEAYIDINDNKDKSWSNECLDFINRCLKRNVANRLGYQLGVKELKAHPWFAKYDWLNLYNKKLIAPYIPKKGKNFDQNYCESKDKISNSTFERYKGYMRKNDYVKIFEGYTYFNNDVRSNTIENETVTRVSTSTKGNNKQELNENQSYGNIYSNINNDKLYAITPIKNIIESSISNRGNNSIDNKMIIVDRKNNENKDIKNYQYFVQSNNFNTRQMMKMEENKKAMNKKQISVDILNINKQLRKEINNRITENYFFNHYNNFSKNDSFEVKEENSNNLNLIENNNNIHNNNIDININNNPNNIKVHDINNNLKELSLYKKVKKKNISNSIEKQIQENNEQFSKNINKNISVYDFKKYKKKKLNIHSLQTKDSNNEGNQNNEKKVIPLFLPPLSKINNNHNRNNSQNSQLLLSNIKHFKFKITKKKKIRHFNFNQNKIIENNYDNNNSREDGHKPFVKFLYKCSKSNNYRINKKDINNNNENKAELYKKLIENERLQNMNIQLGKSQSSGLFPKIKIS